MWSVWVKTALLEESSVRWEIEKIEAVLHKVAEHSQRRDLRSWKLRGWRAREEGSRWILCTVQIVVRMYKVRQNKHWKRNGEEGDFTVTTSAATGSLGGAGARTDCFKPSFLDVWVLDLPLTEALWYICTFFLSSSVCISVAIGPFLQHVRLPPAMRIEPCYKKYILLNTNFRKLVLWTKQYSL